MIATNLLDRPEIGAVVANIRDVTERKALDDALIVSQSVRSPKTSRSRRGRPQGPTRLRRKRGRVSRPV